MKTKTSTRKKYPKTSLIMTVLNEEGSLQEYLDAIYSQTVLPTEIVIVDGGSTDATINIIKKYKKKYNNINLISAPGATIPASENICIQQSRYPVILGGSAGIEIPKNLFEKLLDNLDEKTDVVGGVYRITGDTFLQKAIADVFQYSLIPDISNPPKHFLPTNRSLAYYKKNVWSKLKEYPAQMKRSDDTWFGQEAIKHGIRMKTMTQAPVTWKARKNLRLVYKYAFLDAESDALMRLATERYTRYWIDFWLIIASVVTLPLTPFVLPLVLLANAGYLGLYSLKVALYSKKWQRTPLYFAVSVTVLLATIIGMLSGTFLRLRTKK